MTKGSLGRAMQPCLMPWPALYGDRALCMLVLLAWWQGRIGLTGQSR